MHQDRIIALAVTSTLLLAGCIRRDEVTTLSIRPDGSARLVMFHSNIRSTEEGAKADQQIQQYVQDFNDRRLGDFTRIEQAGGRVVEARWLQQEVPYSSIIVAGMPDARAIERYLSVKGEDDEFRLTTSYTAEGTRRKLTMTALLPEGFELQDDSDRPPEEVQQERADSFSEVRIAVIGGRIVDARGWTVSSDRRSALLSRVEIARLLRSRPDKIELFIEWDVAEQ